MSKALSKSKINAMFTYFSNNNPNPKTELNYNSTFELLIAVILSAQSTDKGVNKATDILFAKANTPQKILDIGIDGLKNSIKTIGLFNSKANNIIKTCQIILDEHQGEVPNTRESLEKLPGVGRKTANVVLNTAFKQHTMAVDTHIFRLGNRTGLAVGKTVLTVEKKLLKNIPEEFLLNAHHWLILHGRYVCTARSPKCNECKVIDSCNYKNKNIATKSKV